jgi:hypothetical protein
MLRSYLSFCLSLFKSHTQLQLEIVFLRKQLDILARTSAKPRLGPSDRFFFSILSGIFNSWKGSLLILKPETVIRWHKEGFRLHWKWKSRSALGRPRIPQDQIDLIKQMAADNPLWGAPAFTARCSNSGLIFQKPRCSDICPGDLTEQPGSAGKRS